MELTKTLNATDFLVALIHETGFTDTRALTSMAERTACEAFKRLGQAARACIDHAFAHYGLHHPIIRCAWTDAWELSITLLGEDSYDAVACFCAHVGMCTDDVFAPALFTRTSTHLYVAKLKSADIEQILEKVYKQTVRISSKNMAAFERGFGA